LTSLSLRGNNIEQAGGEVLARALTNQNTLRVFDISHNALGDRGAARFARTLVSNTTLTSLDLSSTQLGK
jgi:Ran GTPase-activating protein (RanGAP) involved in mRNA processing and transport